MARLPLIVAPTAQIALAAIMLATAPSAGAQPWLDLGPSLGLPSQLQGPSGPSLSAGITAADLDGDGQLEIIASTPTQGLAIYSRNGPTFELARETLPNIATGGGVFGHTLFDADGDGDLDLFVARDDKDRLYFFDTATSTYVDVTDTHLPRLLGWSASATAVDLDGDGDLDLVLTRYIDRVDFPAHRCFANRIFMNHRGVFFDATPAALAATRGCSFTTVVADYDDDLDLDLIVVNDFAQYTGRLELWENRGFTPEGALDLVEVSALRQLSAPLYGMGAAFDDLDQDGLPELMLTNIGEPLLFTRDPDHNFRVINTDKNLYARFAWDRLQATWTTRFLDLDGDGYLDVLSAGGSLPAAPFIGNPPDQGSVILRGQPGGGLEPLPFALDLPRTGHSVRDFELADLTGDGVDELLAIHIHGRISVFENLDRRGNRTRLELRPSTTGQNAAGTHLSLTCAGLSRSRRVNAGGDYGVYDRPQADLSFPAPCANGLPATGQIRWPSGLVQAFDTTVGTTRLLTEPDWFVLTPDPSPGLPRRGTVTLDLSHHAEPFDHVEFVAHGLTLSPLTALEPKRFTATWELAEPPADPQGARLDLIVDGATWGLHPRIPSHSPTLSFAAQPVAGRRIQLRLVFADPIWTGLTPPTTATATIDGQTFTLTSLSPALLTAAVQLPMTPGPHLLVVTWGAERLERLIEVLPPVSPTDSELIVRELHVLEGERATRRVRMRARLHDANHEPSSLTLDALGLLLDGVPVEPDTRAMESGFMTLGIEHSRLVDGSELTLTLEGVPHFATQRVVQAEHPEAYSTSASIERSRCWFSEPRARADGEDMVTALIQFADEAGTRLPDTGLSPILDAHGLRVAPGSLELGFGGWRVDLIAGTEPGLGVLEARLPGMHEDVRCTLELAPAPRLPDPITSSSIISLTANPVVGQSMVIRVWPLGPDGRSLGSGVPLTLATSDNAVASPLIYVGQGRYQALVTPRAPGPVILQAQRSDGAIIAATTLWEQGEEPDAPPEPGPEAVEVEQEPEPAPEPEPDEDTVEPGPDSHTGPEADAELVEPVEPHEPADVVEVSDISIDGELDTAAPPPDTAEAEPRRPRDEGCSLSPSPALALLIGLFLHRLRRRRQPGAADRYLAWPQRSSSNARRSTRKSPSVV